MTTVEKGITILRELTPEKLNIAVYLLESLAIRDKIEETEELSSEEALNVDQGIAELSAGQGVPAKDVWRDLGI